jgi:peptidoglycan/xylan/chitin deacetylase (PgdA/CDA1 family)
MPRHTLSPAAKSGLCACAATLLLAFLDLRTAWLPLSVFGVACLIAPFCRRYGFYLPVVSRGISRKNGVALTFDDGPDPSSTPELLRLLEAHRACASFFVTGRKTRAYPGLIREILRKGHTLGNHSFSHDPCTVFKGRAALFRDISLTQRALARFGVTPLVYRPPVGITYPALGKVTRGLGLSVVNFSRSARDLGNRRIGSISGRILKKVRANDIIMLHDLAPAKSDRMNEWLSEIERLLTGLTERGLEVRPLAEIIGRPVDLRNGEGPGNRDASSGNCANRADRRRDNHR